MKHWLNSMSRRILVILNIVILFASFVVILGQPTAAYATCGITTRGTLFSVPVEKDDVITVTLSSDAGVGNIFGGTFLGAPFTSSTGNPAIFSATASSAGTLSLTSFAVFGGNMVFTVTFSCRASTFFDPADGRIDGRPGDRLAIWCNTSGNTPNLLIYGVTSDSKGIFLSTVNFADLLKAGNPRYAELKAKLAKLIQSGNPDPVELDNLLAEARREAKLNVLFKKLGGNGTLIIIVDDQNSFTVSWTGGPYGANGQGAWAKSFKCDFKR